MPKQWLTHQNFSTKGPGTHAHVMAHQLGIKVNSQTQSKSDMHKDMAMLYALKSSV